MERVYRKTGSILLIFCFIFCLGCESRRIKKQVKNEISILKKELRNNPSNLDLYLYTMNLPDTSSEKWVDFIECEIIPDNKHGKMPKIMQYFFNMMLEEISPEEFQNIVLETGLKNKAEEEFLIALSEIALMNISAQRRSENNHFVKALLHFEEAEKKDTRWITPYFYQFNLVKNESVHDYQYLFFIAEKVFKHVNTSADNPVIQKFYKIQLDSLKKHYQEEKNKFEELKNRPVLDSFDEKTKKDMAILCWPEFYNYQKQFEALQRVCNRLDYELIFKDKRSHSKKLSDVNMDLYREFKVTFEKPRPFAFKIAAYKNINPAPRYYHLKFLLKEYNRLEWDSDNVKELYNIIIKTGEIQKNGKRKLTEKEFGRVKLAIKQLERYEFPITYTLNHCVPEGSEGFSSPGCRVFQKANILIVRSGNNIPYIREYDNEHLFVTKNIPKNIIVERGQ